MQISNEVKAQIISAAQFHVKCRVATDGDVITREYHAGALNGIVSAVDYLGYCFVWEDGMPVDMVQISVGELF